MFTRTESFREFIRFYPIVSFIVAVNFLFYLVTVFPMFPNYWFIETFSGVNLYIREGEIWRLFTPIFLHGGFSHVLFNSFSIVLFGPALERMLGRGKFLLIYLVTGIAANIATLILEPVNYIHVGSSGAIFGLFGYYIAIVVLRKKAMSRENSQLILTIAAISVIMTFLQPNINITAHLFGLLAGFLIGAAAPSEAGSSETWHYQRQATARRQLFKNISPLKLLIWGAVLVFAIIGFMVQR